MMNRPISITLIAIIFILLGLLSAVDFIAGLIEMRFKINISIFMLVVGIGLMKLKESSRKWAIFWCILIAGISVLGLIGVLFGTAYITVDDTILGGAKGRHVAAALCLLVAVAFIYMNVVLAKSQTQLLFGSRGEGTEPDNRAYR